jgi:hypothetical protein
MYRLFRRRLGVRAWSLNYVLGPVSSNQRSTFQHPDIDQIRKVERMIAYANSKGITVWINCWWGSKDLASQVSEVAIRRWWRYAVHRLHAYNVIWVVAGEYNNYNYGGFSLEFWEQLGKLIKTEDPSERIVSSHPTPPLWAGGADAPQWSTAEVIHNQSWMDYNQCQCGHSQSRNHLIPGIVQNAYTKEPAKPIVVTEPWYEFVPDNAPAKEIRFGAWSAILSGAAGHSYGGGHIWLAYLPETPWSDNKWPLDPSFAINTCYYPGAVSIGFLSKYLRQLRWWELEPHPELLPGNSGNFCAARPGKEYLIYLPNGGSQELDLTAASGIFKIERLDLQHNQIFPGEPVSGGQGITLSAADTNDWAIRVYQ